MTALATRRILLGLLRAHGSAPVVAVDVDAFARFASESGQGAAAMVQATIARLLRKLAGASQGEVHVVSDDRFLLALPSLRYDEAVVLGEGIVAAVRALNVACGVDVTPARRLSVTVAVTSVENVVDADRFDRVVNDLLRDGKSTGGDVVVRDPRPPRA